MMLRIRICIVGMFALVASVAFASYSYIVTPAAETVVSVDSWSGSLAVRGRTAGSATAAATVFVDSRGRTSDYGIIDKLNTTRMSGILLIVR